jgi:hypothetical protein
MSLGEEIVSNMLTCMSFITLSCHCPVTSQLKKGTSYSNDLCFFHNQAMALQSNMTELFGIGFALS